MQSKIAYYYREVEDLKTGKYVNPVTCEIDPSNICNLDCSFCFFKRYRDQVRDVLNFRTFHGLVIDLVAMGVRSITFTGGGEPLLNQDFNDMHAFALDNAFETGLVTNGTRLGGLKQPFRFEFIRVSLDAATAETYQRIKGRDSFQTVVDNVAALVEAKASAATAKTTIGLSYVVNPGNVFEVEKAKDLAALIGVDYIQFKPALMANGQVYPGFENISSLRDNVILTGRHRAEDSFPCQIAHLVGIVGANANVYYCCQTRGNKKFALGSLHEESLRSIWERRLSLNPDVRKCARCRYMNYVCAYNEVFGKNVETKHINFL